MRLFVFDLLAVLNYQVPFDNCASCTAIRTQLNCVLEGSSMTVPFVVANN